MVALVLNGVCFVANVGFYAADHHWWSAAAAAASLCAFLCLLSVQR